MPKKYIMLLNGNFDYNCTLKHKLPSKKSKVCRGKTFTFHIEGVTKVTRFLLTGRISVCGFSIVQL